MSVSPVGTTPALACRCPVCGAQQPWSDACRRCHCDLRLLRAAAETWEDQRRRCLVHLRRGETAEALAAAEACWRIAPNSHAARLRAVCRLLAKDWRGALLASRLGPHR